MKEFTQQELKEIFFGDTPDGATHVSGPDWDDDGKYQFASTIYKVGELFYQIDASRSGSYYTEYYYSWEDEPLVAYEVVPVERTIVEYVTK